jgi:hypothetical protein
MAISQGMVQIFGSAAVFFILPHVDSISTSQRVTVGVCCLSMMATLVYNAIDRKYEGHLSAADLDYCDTPMTAHSGSEDKKLAKYHSISIQDNIDTPEESRRWSDALSFTPLFWLHLAHIGFTSPILYTFTAFGPVYLQENFASTRSPEAAGNVISLLYLSIVAAPLMGLLVDRLGNRILIQFIAAANIPVIFVFLAYEVLAPSTCLIWMGLIYSITEANATAIISLIVPSKRQGSAFGLYGCAISFALLI